MANVTKQVKVTKKSLMVVQANCLIGTCVDLSLNEHKLLRFLIAKIYRKGADLGAPIRFSARELNEALELEESNCSMYSRSIKCLETLTKTKFYFKDEHDAKKVLYVSWVSSFHLSQEDYDTKYVKYIDVFFAPELSAYLQNLGETYSYLKYNLDEIVKFRSAYSLILYELLLKDVRIGKLTYYDTIEDFRKSLGVEEFQYVRLSNLRDRVIDTALAEIKAHTDLKVSFKWEKEYQSVVGITINIQKKETAKQVDEVEVEKTVEVRQVSARALKFSAIVSKRKLSKRVK